MVWLDVHFFSFCHFSPVLDFCLFIYSCLFQTWIFVAWWAEETWARRGVPDKSLLEILPNTYAGGHLLPAPHDGGRLCWTGESSSDVCFSLCLADLALSMSTCLFMHLFKTILPFQTGYLKEQTFTTFTRKAHVCSALYSNAFCRTFWSSIH